MRANHLAEAVTVPTILSISNQAIMVFGTNDSVTAGRTLVRTIQNIGTNPFTFICYGTNISLAIATNQSRTNLHGIVKGGAPGTTDSGWAADGWTVDLSFWRRPVYVMVPTNSAGATNQTRIAIVEFTQ